MANTGATSSIVGRSAGSGDQHRVIVSSIRLSCAGENMPWAARAAPKSPAQDTIT